MTELDRADVIALLGQLGAADDATVLAAARALHRQAVESGCRWEEIVRPASDAGNPTPDAALGQSGDEAALGPLIDRLLRKEMSDTLRNDLAEMKRQIAEGTLDPMDADYLRALGRRLGT